MAEEVPDSALPPGLPPLFPRYLDEATVQAGLRARTLYEGSLRQSHDNLLECTVGHDALEEDVLIVGGLGRNRALAGDLVVFKLLPEKSPTSPPPLTSSLVSGVQCRPFTLTKMRQTGTG